MAHSVSLCRYEELARHENRQRKARASTSVLTTQQLAGVDDLKSMRVDMADDFPGAER